MEALGLHLSSAISDHYLDLQGHHGNYPYQPVPSNHWHGRHDNTRMYNHSHGNEFETQARFTNDGEKDDYTTENVQSQAAIGEDTNTDWSTDDVKQSDKSDQDSPRQSQVALTLTWLNENYERADGVCLPRCVLYQHYLDFCKKMKFTPAGAATFGKIIRQKFPKLTTRRLGTRGQSKYHYYGIGIKESSIYYHSVYTGKGLTRFSGIKLKTEGSSRKYSLSSKTGTLLPEFPNAENLILPDGIELEKMSTFIMMYRTHSQRILDTVISGNFEEVQNFLVHFWQGMPDHLIDLLKCDILSDIIALCDSILYKVLVDVLIPSSIQELPTSLSNDMEMFLKKLPYWLETSMEMVPKHIQDRKQEVAKNFIQSLRRQSSFVNLAQTARPVLSSQDQLNKIVRDINNIDFTDICSQAGFMEASANPKLCAKLQRFYTEFKELLSKQTQIESYTEWIDEVIDRCVIQPSDHDYEVFKDKAAEFLLQWEAFGALLMRELTLKNASTFVSIHLVHLMLDEYAFLVIETQQEQEVEKHLQKGVQKYMKTAEEISTKAVVRNANNKNMNSPKCKKRKIIEEFDQDMAVPSIENSTINTDIHSHTPCPSNGVVNGTAFSRPVPTMKDTPTNSVHQSEQPRHHQNTISIPTIKSYPSYNSSYDRPTYIPQFGIGSYSEYVGPSPSFAPGRIPNYSDSYSQTFPSNPFSSSISPVASNYWTDSRSHPSFTDPYQPYNYNKLSATYESLNKSTFLRNNPYQDNLGRPSFDSARPFYRGTHDNLQGIPDFRNSVVTELSFMRDGIPSSGVNVNKRYRWERTATAFINAIILRIKLEILNCTNYIERGKCKTSLDSCNKSQEFEPNIVSGLGIPESERRVDRWEIPTKEPQRREEREIPSQHSPITLNAYISK